MEQQRELYGDKDHCSLHRDRRPGWRCPKCHKFLCRDCVSNKPIIEGGADWYFCAVCDMEVTRVKRDKGINKLASGLFKKI